MAPVVHPGRLLKRELVARKLSANRLSLDIGVPSGRITDILNGRRAITADTAVRLSRYFSNSAQFWLDLQVNMISAWSSGRRAPRLPDGSDRRMRHEPVRGGPVARSQVMAAIPLPFEECSCYVPMMEPGASRNR
jgi:addiction module HigA family antidote